MLLGWTATMTPTPGPTTSGLMRPSEVGPRELKPATLPSESVAPTATISWASAGVSSVADEGPLLPTATTTSVPRAAALSAATVVTATSPLSCW